MTMLVFGRVYLILIHIRFLPSHFSVFSLLLVLIEKVYQKLNTAFNQIS